MTETTRPKRGRPRQPAEARRDDRLPDIRVTAVERSQIEGNAARAGLKVSDFIRRAALGQHVRAKKPPAIGDAIRELNAIGTNLNQITARMHLTGELADSLPALIVEVYAQLDRLAADDS